MPKAHGGRGSLWRAARGPALLLVASLSVALAAGPSAQTQRRQRPSTPVAAPTPAAAVPQVTIEAPPGAPPPKFTPTPTPAPHSPATPDPRGAQAVDDDEVVRVETSEVLLPVTVRDADGRLVSSLRRDDFRVIEDGREQPLSDLSLRQAPVDVALLVDSSSSVAANFEDFRRAADEFAGRVSPEDRFSLVKFDDRVELLLDWSRSRLQMRRALRRLSPGVFTRFNDALMLSARDHFGRDQRRHALVVLSDGIDSNQGAATLDAALRALLEAQVTVYVIANTEIERARKQAELDRLLSGPPSSVRFNEIDIDRLRASLRALDASERNLTDLTRATGGRLYRPETFAALDRVYTEIAEELRHQYALYYTPTNPARDGRFRRVRVETPGRPLQVYARVGYYAPRG